MTIEQLKAALEEAHYALEEAEQAVDYLYHREDVYGTEVPLASLFIREQACKVLKVKLNNLQAQIAEFEVK